LLWDEQSGATKAMRGKEDSHDYRYFPEPDLSPVYVDDTWIDNMRKLLPELPAARKQRFMDSFGFKKEDADTLTSEKEIADYFEELIDFGVKPKLALNWVRNEVLRIISELGKSIDASPVSPKALSELLFILDKNEITAQTAKAVLDNMAATGKSAESIIDEKGLKQISDSSELETLIDTILAENEANVNRFREGEAKLMGFFIGQVMRSTQGKADQALTREILLKKLG
jgi:aspartyl-tRNA(Asn)/glutamyl-tRNA(Gln) amidotransferase subunit B